MIYSINNKPESILTDFSIDIMINVLKQTLKRIKKNKKIEKLNLLDVLNSDIEVLKNEIYNPKELQFCDKVLFNEIKVSDEDIKSFLFSIISPSKLQNIGKWLSDKEVNISNFYKVDVIFHFYKYSTENENLYTNQLLSLNNNTQSCNLTLEALIRLIQKTIDNLYFDNKRENIQPVVVNSLLEILKLEIFNSNSTRLFIHKSSKLDDKVKDYLFSLLSIEKIKILKNWICSKDIFHNKTNLGIITSIYAPDY